MKYLNLIFGLTGVNPDFRYLLENLFIWQFNWGGFLLKSNGGVQRYPQPGWQSGVERKGRRVLDCKSHKTSRAERRT